VQAGKILEESIVLQKPFSRDSLVREIGDAFEGQRLQPAQLL